MLPTLFILSSVKTLFLISLVFKEYKMGLMQGGIQEASDRHSTRWSGSKRRTRSPIEKIQKMGV